MAVVALLSMTAALVVPGTGQARSRVAAQATSEPDSVPDQSDTVLDQVEAACGSFDPFYAMANHIRVGSDREAPDEPAIVAFRHDRSRLTLATNGQVGTVFGLAYDHRRGHLYAAAYNKRATTFGPGGTGGVYRVDLADGRVETVVSLYGGADQHDHIRQQDSPAGQFVGRNSLGDIDLSEDGNTLLVMNLAEGRIYRIRIPDGTVIDSFRHGAAGLSWERNARPFGLGVRDGWLYHGLVDSQEFANLGGQLSAFVYRSRLDGSDMTELVRFNLDYPRPFVPWVAWSRGPSEWIGTTYRQVNTQPMLTDIEFTDDGGLVVGLRDRIVDMIPSLGRVYPGQQGTGDIIPIGESGGLWAAFTDPEVFEDQLTHDESSFGGLAGSPDLPMLVSSARDPVNNTWLGAMWNWDHGGLARTVSVVPWGQNTLQDRSNGLGDVEALCAPEGLDPGAVPTATSFAATATRDAQATETALIHTPAPGPRVTPTAFATHIAETCGSNNPFAATVCYPPSNLIQFNYDADAVVAFRDTAADSPIYGVVRVSQVGASWGLAYRATTGHILTSSYMKRLTEFGTAGPGGVYRVDIQTGDAAVLAALEAGEDTHLGNPNAGDYVARDLVGKTSLGDMDLSPDEDELFVMNLHDRRIYRLDPETGKTQGAFDHGAAGEDWSADARPFGLGVRGTKLYHGVVNSAETSQTRADLEARVYESDYDGGGMRLVAAFPLTYTRGTIEVAGVIGQGNQTVPLDWQPWRDGENDVSDGRAQLSFYPQPVLSDIAFEADGTMVVAIKDRHADMSVAIQITQGGIVKPGMGLGDLLRLDRGGGGAWRPPADWLPYHLPASSHAERAFAGGIARAFRANKLLANWIEILFNPTFNGIQSYEGVLGFDPVPNLNWRERVCQTQLYQQPRPTPIPLNPTAPAPLANRDRGPEHSEWVPGKGMGDLEVLCGPTPTPTSTPVEPTVTPTRTLVPSPTPTPGPIYLPVLLRENCEDRRLRADVVLVLDVSTSMRRQTAAGRSKLEATLEAAKSFLGNMDFNPEGGHDQVAIAGFNDNAWIESPLGRDRPAIEAAVDRLRSKVDQGTRLDRALTVGAEGLEGPRRIPDNTPVMVLLTDGLPNRVPTPVAGGGQEDTVLAAAEAAKAKGIVIYTIGVGRPDAQDIIDRINPELLRGVASAPENFYQTPDAEALAGIYSEIARTIACPRGRHDWTEPWP